LRRVSTRNYVLGFDLGGSSLKTCALFGDGRRSSVRRSSLPGDADALIGLFSQLVLDYANETGDTAQALALGTPGVVDDSGQLHGAAVNLPGWEGIALGQELEALFDFPTCVGNDVDYTALAEARLGAGRHASSVFLFSLGTGIGGGFVADGRLWTGYRGGAGEVGHIVVEPGGRTCSCGVRGCLERYASATGLVLSAAELASDHPRSALTPQADALEASDISKAYHDGDELAVACYRVAGERLAQAIAMVAVTLAPECIVLGGGVMTDAPPILENIEASIDQYLFDVPRKRLGLHVAELGPDAGALGAALVAQALVPRETSGRESGTRTGSSPAN
jgi:glucokinase